MCSVRCSTWLRTASQVGPCVVLHVVCVQARSNSALSVSMLCGEVWHRRGKCFGCVEVGHNIGTWEAAFCWGQCVAPSKWMGCMHVERIATAVLIDMSSMSEFATRSRFQDEIGLQPPDRFQFCIWFLDPERRHCVLS